MSLDRLALRSLRAHPLRASLSALGVALGVAVLVAVMATTAGVDASVRSTVTHLVGSADLRVAAFGEDGLSKSTVSAIAETPGVATAAPALERRTYLASALGASPTAALPPPVTVLGIDPVLDPRLHTLTLTAGEALDAPAARSALISERLAADDGLSVGSPITIEGAGDRVSYRVIGILAGDGPSDDAAGRTVVVPLQTAQTAFGEATVTRVDIGLADGASVAAVEHALEGTMTAEPYVLSTPADIAATLRASTTDFSVTIGLIAAIALFAGAFLIFNTLSMTVAERIREVGLLRAAGASRRQVMSFMLVQALTLGIAGSALGLVFGFVLAAVIASAMGTVGSVAIGSPVLPLDAAVLAVVVGIGVTIAAALEPARRASRIQPVEALRAHLDPPAARTARLRWLAVVFVIVAVVGLVILPRAAGDTAAAQGLIVYAILLGATLLIPFVLPAMARLAGIPFAAVMRVEERVARSAIVRDRSRTTLTLGALTIGLAMIVALGGVGQQARAAAAGWIEGVIPGDLVLTSIRPIGADEAVPTGLLDASPQIARVSPIGLFDVGVGGNRTDAAAVSGADLDADGRLTFVSGDRTAALTALDAGGATVLPAALADRFHLAVGNVISVPTATGAALDLGVAGIVERSIPGETGEAMLIGWADATNELGVAGADMFAVRLAAGGSTAATEASLRETAAGLALEVVTLGQVDGAIGDTLGKVFTVFDALAAVAVLIAALGIINTLTINVIERVREIGILRAAGMTRRQVWRSVVVEAGVLGLAGALLGVVLGLAVGALMVVLAGGRIDLGGGMPWAVIVFAITLGVVVAMLAAAYPARIASRLSIVRAVHFE
ncbi:MAG: FtsX-like permease family protein [Chloroflexota bacterium]